MLIETWVQSVSDLGFCNLALYERMLDFAGFMTVLQDLGAIWGMTVEFGSVH